MKRIEILYLEGCPNHGRAVELVKSAIRDLQVEASLQEIAVGPDDAIKFRFLGSPTIRIDGVDIEPESRQRSDFGFSCRTYAGGGCPDRGMLIAALQINVDSERTDDTPTSTA